jgi:hypothetical protein
MTPLRPGVHPFLLGLLRNHPVPPLPVRDDALSWRQILCDTLRHSLTVLVHQWFKQQGRSDVAPHEFWNELQAAHRRQIARTLWLTQELVSILEMLEHRALCCAPIRGLTLGLQLYGDVASRPSGDVDLLVPRESLLAVADALKALGYQELDRRPGFARAYSYTLEFIKHQHDWITVEPHWTLAYPPFTDRLDMPGIWSRTTETRVLGLPARTLDSSDLLLHLCLHLIHAGTQPPLLWYYDIDRLIRLSKDLDWARLVQQSVGSGQAALVGRALRDVEALFDTPIPHSIFPELATRASMDRLPSCRLALLIERGASIDGIESFAYALTLAGFRRKLHYIGSLLFPSVQFMRLHYGLGSSRSIAWWYARRFGFLFVEGAKAMRVLLMRHSPSHTTSFL